MDERSAMVADFVARIGAYVAPRESNAFVPLADPAVAIQFERAMAAVSTGDEAEAQYSIDILNAEGLGYHIVRYGDPQHKTTVAGFVERARPGTPRYRGWGGVLVRRAGNRRRVYQAPHVLSDAYTLSIAARAFADDPDALALVVAGAHRYANGETPPIADVTRSPDNLFHVLTASLARAGRDAGTPYWFVQFHGSHDRQGQPMITASDGSQSPCLAPNSALVRIKQLVERHGALRMGVCGWPDASDEPYLLCGKENIQGMLLERMGLRATFMHFELEHRLRHTMHHGVEPGYGNGLALLAAIREVLE
jgi:hypothetical protein